jgi:major membrane immunogen (membrane-anchored lipoprotein)
MKVRRHIMIAIVIFVMLASVWIAGCTSSDTQSTTSSDNSYGTPYQKDTGSDSGHGGGVDPYLQSQIDAANHETNMRIIDNIRA